MTLDEAIKHCEEKAEELNKEVLKQANLCNVKEVAECQECAREHEQLAEWLKELVELRSQRSSEFDWCKGCKEHDEENHCCHRLSNFIQTQAQEIHDVAYEEGKNDRPTGEWIEKGKYQVECNQCHYDDCAIKTNFCPNCGAEMKGGAEE